MSKTLEERIQRLEDIEAIKDVTARYSFNINKGWNGKEVNPGAFTAIFDNDAVWEAKMMNTKATSLKQIMNGLLPATENVEFSMHTFTNPVIEIVENTASGNWLFWIATRHKSEVPNEIFMSADITYTRTIKGWLIKTFNLYYGMRLLNP